MRKINISEQEYNEIVKAEKETQDKQISRKLRVLILRYKGLSNKEIGKMVDLCEIRVSQIVRSYKEQGLKMFIKKKYGGNNRNMTEAEEKEILDGFKNQANLGHIIVVKEIKEAFDKKLGRDTGRGYIYMLLKRHGWRKVMPRSKHPKKASQEAIDASKKITIS